MGGTVLFQDALRQRLNIMQTSQQKVQEFLAAHPPRISKGKAAYDYAGCRLCIANLCFPWARNFNCSPAGIPELVSLLQSRGTGVFLVSGGFRVIIDPIADILKIPRDHVYANRILFNVRATLLLCNAAHAAFLLLTTLLTPCTHWKQEDGSYAGFDETELTSRSGGKAAAARLIKVPFLIDKLLDFYCALWNHCA